MNKRTQKSVELAYGLLTQGRQPNDVRRITEMWPFTVVVSQWQGM
jgi:hypothetical protein